MAQLQRVEEQIELKCNANKFFEIWTSKAHLMPKMCPNKVAKVELVEGEWNTVGAIHDWTYRLNDNGKSMLTSSKTRAEKLDFENGSFTYSIIEGYVLENYYKSCKAYIEVSPKGEGCSMKTTFEYEKLNEDAPEPNMLINTAFEIAKDIDVHLCSA